MLGRSMKPKQTVQLPSLKLYRSIHRLPLPIFIDCLVGKEYERLVIEGQATEIELQECFDDLYTQYIEASGGKDVERGMEQICEFKLRGSLLVGFESLLKALQIAPTEELFNQLYEYHQFLPVRKEYSVDGINAVVRSMMPHYKRTKFLYDREIEFKNATAPTKKITAYSYEYFASMLAEISTAFTMNIDENISVGMFCAYIVKYKNKAKIMEQQKSKVNNG